MSKSIVAGTVQALVLVAQTVIGVLLVMGIVDERTIGWLYIVQGGVVLLSIVVAGLVTIVARVVE
jgi:hypothetical protein